MTVKTRCEILRLDSASSDLHRTHLASDVTGSWGPNWRCYTLVSNSWHFHTHRLMTVETAARRCNPSQTLLILILIKGTTVNLYTESRQNGILNVTIIFPRVKTWDEFVFTVFFNKLRNILLFFQLYCFQRYHLNQRLRNKVKGRAVSIFWKWSVPSLPRVGVAFWYFGTTIRRRQYCTNNINTTRRLGSSG